jgi:hypothetical protein
MSCIYCWFNGYLQLLCCHLWGFLVLLFDYFPALIICIRPISAIYIKSFYMKHQCPESNVSYEFAFCNCDLEANPASPSVGFH